MPRSGTPGRAARPEDTALSTRPCHPPLIRSCHNVERRCHNELRRRKRVHRCLRRLSRSAGFTPTANGQGGTGSYSNLCGGRTDIAKRFDTHTGWSTNLCHPPTLLTCVSDSTLQDKVEGANPCYPAADERFRGGNAPPLPAGRALRRCEAAACRPALPTAPSRQRDTREWPCRSARGRKSCFRQCSPHPGRRACR